MKKEKKNTPAKLILLCILFTIVIIGHSMQSLFSPHMFVRGMNLIAVIIGSAAVGAFIREIFVLKAKQKSHS